MSLDPTAWGVDAATWAEVYRLLDVPLIVCVVILTAQIRQLVPPRWWPVLPVGIAMAVALIVPSPFPLTPWNYWRRVMVYGAGAALAWNCRKVWLRRLPGGEGTMVEEQEGGAG